jgi:Flp pilus assembly protein TadG
MRLLRQFILGKSGAFAPTTALVLVPLLMTAGLAVDYTNILRVRNELQNSVDSAAIAVANRNDQLSDGEARQMADSFVDENFDPNFTQLNVLRSGQQVTVTARTKVSLAFGGLFGFRNVALEASAKTEVAYANYEIALALDTTGSMAGGKIIAMKDAVNGMIDTMVSQNAGRGLLKFSIVPFSSMVNVGTQFGPAYNSADAVTRQPAPWLDSLADSPIAQSDLDTGVSRFALYKHLGMPWPGCVESRPIAGGVDYGLNDTEPNPAQPQTLYVPSFASDEPNVAGYPNSYLSDMGSPIGSGTVADRMARYGAVYAPSFK